MAGVYSFVRFGTIAILPYIIQVTLANKCYKDKNLGEREGNIYYCDSKDLPTCCTETEGPTCCLDNTEKNITEQLQLWGTVAAMIFIIGILFACCKNDISFCSSETSLKDRWQNFREKKKSGHQHLEEENSRGQYYDNPIGGFDKGRESSLDPFRYPSLPPSNFEKRQF